MRKPLSMINDIEGTAGTYLAIQPKPLYKKLCVVSFVPAGLRPTTRPFGLLSAIMESFGRPFVSAAIAEYWSCVVATVNWGKEVVQDKRRNVLYSA